MFLIEIILFLILGVCCLAVSFFGQGRQTGWFVVQNYVEKYSVFYANNLIVVELFWIFSKFCSLNFGFPGFFGGPMGFRKVREVCRKNFLQFSFKSDFRKTSYDQKTEKAHDD